MGLIKKDGCKVKGVLIQPAYAKLTNFFTLPKEQNKIIALFGISTTRDNLDNNLILEEIQITMTFNRKEDLFNQMYTNAKQNEFKDWEDDII